tara:strand:- start:20694 stop:21548 length:855 start_codon:yes stop_codon:yes gene_type:complete
MKSTKILFVIAAATLTLWSCEKGQDIPNEENMSVAASVELSASVDEVEGLMEEIIFYAVNFIEIDGLAGKGCHDRSGFFPECATLEAETVEDTITINIGFAEGCTDRHGNALSGTITLVKTGNKESGNATITFTDLTINGYVVNGTKSLAYTKDNANGNPEMSGMVDISVMTEAGTISKEGNRMIEVTAGGDTETYEDDEVTITGSFTYTGVNGGVFTIVIDPALVKPAGCKYIAQGVKTFNRDGMIATLDYGDGTCDKVATLTDAEGVVTEINIRHGRRKFHD